MGDKKDLSKVSVKELEMCPYDIEYLECAGIHTIQDILDYIKDGSRLYYIKGVHDNMERDILQCLERQFDIEYPYRDMGIEEYLRIYRQGEWKQWCEVRDKLVASEPTILSKTLHEVGLSNRVVHLYERAGFNTVGDIVAYKCAGGDLKEGIRNAGDSAVEEIFNMLNKNNIPEKYDDLSEPVKSYIDRRINWMPLSKLGFPHKVILRFYKEGFTYVGQVRDYLSKGNAIQDILWEDGLTDDFDKLCNYVMNKLYKNGIPFSKEVNY